MTSIKIQLLNFILFFLLAIYAKTVCKKKMCIRDSLCSICSLDDVLSFHNLSQVSILIHLADTASHAPIIGQCVLQYKTCHTGLAAIHQILMDSLKAFLSIVIICVDHNEWGINRFLRCKHSLTGSPRLCPAFRKFSRKDVYKRQL